MEEVAERGILVTATSYESTPTIALTWALILAGAHHLVREAASRHGGGWQAGTGTNLRDKCLGVVGLGNIGKEVARIGLAFGMRVIAWSQNLKAKAASAAGATLVAKDTPFRQADFLTVHLVLSRRTIRLVGSVELAFMKPTAQAVNTSRGQTVDHAALIAALQPRKIAEATLDVFDVEPLPAHHEDCDTMRRCLDWRGLKCCSSVRRSS